MNESQIEQMQLGDADLLTRDPDMTIVARLKADPEFAIALYHEQRQRIAELEDESVVAAKLIKALPSQNLALADELIGVKDESRKLKERIAELEQSYAAGLEAKCPHTLRRAVIDSLNERITTLEKALETLMDDYQYNVCFDYNYAAARKVLKGEEK